MSRTPSGVAAGDFLPEGRTRPTANGWSWITAGFELFRRQPGTWIGIILVWLVLSILVSMVPILGSLANQVLSPVLVAGMMIASRELEAGRAISVGSLFAGFSEKPGPLAAIGALSLLAIVIIVVVVAVAFGLELSALSVAPPSAANLLPVLTAVMVMLLLLVPVYMAIWFAPALIVFDDLPVIDALRGSFFGCMRNAGSLLVYGLVLLGLCVLAAIPLGLGFLVLIPVIFASVYVAYRDIYHAR